MSEQVGKAKLKEFIKRTHDEEESFDKMKKNHFNKLEAYKNILNKEMTNNENKRND